MAYITREDGERFIIPSYRDVMSAKRKNQLKKDIMLLSQSYGEYITMQKKNSEQYEIAFSTETGYLLGESIWHFFKRPEDLIYCEAVPNTSEAIMVIVKNGSVYLDGRFPIESIPEELVIFLTQQNNFDIYLYGDVPISQTPADDKFSFDPTSVKSFNVLDNPVFPTLPLLRVYQLQLVDQVLKQNGIGVFPARQLLIILAAIGALWILYTYITAERPQTEVTKAPEVDPLQGYIDAMRSPEPEKVMNAFVNGLLQLNAMPGWTLSKIDYSNKNMVAGVKTPGSKVQTLEDWATSRQAFVEIKSDGVYVTMSFNLSDRAVSRELYPLQDSIEKFIDRLIVVYPGNNLRIEEPVSQGAYVQQNVVINISEATAPLLKMIGQQMQDLPIIIKEIKLTAEEAGLSGSINLTFLGS
jgi:hypothetical protein